MALTTPKTDTKEKSGKGMNLPMDTKTETSGKGLDLKTTETRDTSGKGLDLKTTETRDTSGKGLDLKTTETRDTSGRGMMFPTAARAEVAMDASKSRTTDFSNQGTEFTVASVNTDGVEIKETYFIPDFPKWHGYYRKIPELRVVINKFASWTFGRGIEADKQNKKKLDKIRGMGKESARSVLKNQWRTAMICGDSFAHIIPGGNLKPLNPGKVAIVANAEGIIVRYEMEAGGGIIRFDVDEIYHLSYERIADEIHGIPFPEALEELIISRNEAIRDLRVLYHRTVKPILVWEAQTDNTTKLGSLEDTINNAFKKTESIIIPAGVIKEIKRASSPVFSTGEVNSLAYIKFLVRVLVTATGMPEVVMGWGAETTEASSKIILVSYEQEIWDMKLYNEEMIEIQLNITINIEPAPSLMDELIKDNKKDGKVEGEKKSEIKPTKPKS